MRRRRKSSTRITLVLLGAAALAGCGADGDDGHRRRDVYASKEDCVADWGSGRSARPRRRRSIGPADGRSGSGRRTAAGGVVAGERGRLVAVGQPLDRQHRPQHVARRLRLGAGGRPGRARHDGARAGDAAGGLGRAVRGGRLRVHSIDGTYWDESRCYRFTVEEIDRLEAAAAELSARCLGCGRAHRHAAGGWRAGDPARVARARRRGRGARASRRCSGASTSRFDGRGPPKLLEYNADTPTALLEASVVQWHWLQQAMLPREPGADQFNSLHEKLIASWRALAIAWSARRRRPLHLRAPTATRTAATSTTCATCATQAGVDAGSVGIDDIGWDRPAACSSTPSDDEIAVL